MRHRLRAALDLECRANVTQQVELDNLYQQDVALSIPTVSSLTTTGRIIHQIALWLGNDAWACAVQNLSDVPPFKLVAFLANFCPGASPFSALLLTAQAFPRPRVVNSGGSC